jgi:hypothetical protein
MKLRLMLFLFSSPLFYSLSSRSLNAQQEARRRNGGRDNSDYAVSCCAARCGYGRDDQRASCPTEELILMPGIYELTAAIRVTRPHTVVLGLGVCDAAPDEGHGGDDDD